MSTRKLEIDAIVSKRVDNTTRAPMIGLMLTNVRPMRAFITDAMQMLGVSKIDGV